MREHLKRWQQCIRRPEVLMALPVVVGMISLAGAWHWHSQQREAALRWQSRAERCVELANQIVQVREQPRQYEEQVLEAQRLASSIEDAGHRSGMAPERIEAIRPQPPQRVQDTPYVESFTRVRLRDVSIRQLAEMLFQLRQQVKGLSVPDLRLWVANRETERWQAELGLAGLAYLPAEQRSDEGGAGPRSRS